MLVLWKIREKGFIPKYTYDLGVQRSGTEYQIFLDENYGDHPDIDSIKNIRDLASNIQNWEKV